MEQPTTLVVSGVCLSTVNGGTYSQSVGGRIAVIVQALALFDLSESDIVLLAHVGKVAEHAF